MKKAIKFIAPTIIIVLLGFFMLNDNQPKVDFSKELPAILAAIDQEIKFSENPERMLSDSLIMGIRKLANSLTPSELIDESTGIERMLSAERGILLSALVNKKLNASTYQAIFEFATFENAFLEKTDLSNAPLDHILLNRAYFKNVDLSGASLNNANLYKVHFKNVNLAGAHLEKSNLREANLDGSNLSKANLASAYLREAKVRGVQMEDSILDNANLTGVNLNETAKGLVDF